MKLPVKFNNHQEWTLVGPMGPPITASFNHGPVIAVDGGADFCDSPDIWVGDSDSTAKKTRPEFSFPFPSQKSASDLALALQLLSSLKTPTLHLWGFSGGRLDHELINFGEVYRFLETHPGSWARFYGPKGECVSCIYSQGNWSFERHGNFTLATLRDISVELTGQCKYPLTAATVVPVLSSLGLSNEGQGKINLITTGPIMVLFSENL